MGAWIETEVVNTNLIDAKSHPTWVRGLKLGFKLLKYLGYGSHPTWVRGLKQSAREIIGNFVASHPTWVRGLKRPK
mgnify:CR=1 FL=1